MMRSTERIVFRRWAMMIEVRPRVTCPMPRWITASVSGSMLAVASSITSTISGSKAATRASASSCFCPVERFAPRSASIVS